MRISTFQKPAPALFASVRGSRDLSLVAFGTALLVAAALQMGAFIPRIGSPAPAPAHESAAIAVQPATPAPVPAAVAASPAAPCALPRG